MTQLPDSMLRGPDEVTVAWLTAALGPELLGGAVIRDVRAEPIGVESGFASRIARLQVSYERAAPGLPTSLILKLPLCDERSTVAPDDRNRVEAGFYAELAGGVGIPVPRCYLARYDEPSGAMVLLLEDLRGDGKAWFGDASAGCGTDEAAAVIDALAALHGGWWQASALTAHAWVRRSGGFATQLARLAERRPVFMARYGALVPAQLVALTDSLGPGSEPLFESLASAPATLLHVDTHLDNVAFRAGADTDGIEAILFDWQHVSRGACALDLAQFLGGSLTVSHRRADEARLLERYHAGLVARGVDGFGYDDLMTQYRAASLRWWTGTVNGFGSAYAAHWVGRQAEVAARAVERRVAVLVDQGVSYWLP